MYPTALLMFGWVAAWAFLRTSKPIFDALRLAMFKVVSPSQTLYTLKQFHVKKNIDGL
jgi:hypothetical protein